MTDVVLDHATTEIPAIGQRPAGKVTYTVKEVAVMLGINLGGTYQLIRNGEIPAMKLGGRWIVPVHRFHTWLGTDDVTSRSLG